MICGDRFVHTYGRPAEDAQDSRQREYQRRAQPGEQAVRAAHPRLRWAAGRTRGEPQHQRAWLVGGAGERAVGRALDGLVGDGVLVLHDRRLRDERGRLARGTSTTWRCPRPGCRWSMRRRTAAVWRCALGRAVERSRRALWIGGRNETSLVDGVLGQAAAVRRELDRVGADVACTRCWRSSARSCRGGGAERQRCRAGVPQAPGEVSPAGRRPDGQACEDVTGYLAARLPSA